MLIKPFIIIIKVFSNKRGVIVAKLAMTCHNEHTTDILCDVLVFLIQYFVCYKCSNTVTNSLY